MNSSDSLDLDLRHSEYDNDFNKRILLLHSEELMGSVPINVPTRDELLSRLPRQHRHCLAYAFRRDYNYGPDYDERTFVWPDRTIPLRAKSSGIVWAAVHGTHSICVVTRTRDLDLARARHYLSHLTVESLLPDFRLSVISELEDFASPYGQLSESFGRSVPKPFGVVSVNLGSDRVHEESDHEASSAEYDVRAATKFLKEEMEGSTGDEVIKSAISAFQKLFHNKKFKAEEIEVSVMDPEYLCSLEAQLAYTDMSVKHLAMSEIEDYLAAINSLSVCKNMDGRRKDRREITELFADSKRKLCTMSIEDSESSGDYSRNKKKKQEHMTTKSRAVGVGGTETPASPMVGVYGIAF